MRSAKPFRQGILGVIAALLVVGTSLGDSFSYDDEPASPSDAAPAMAVEAEEAELPEEPPLLAEPKPVADHESVCNCRSRGVGGICERVRAGSKPATAAYKGLFYDNSFNYLCDPCYNGWHLGENLKRRSIGDDFVFDVGGEYRMRFHHENNLRGVALSNRPIPPPPPPPAVPSPGVRNDDFLLQRTRLYLNTEYCDWFRAYVEAVDAASDGHRHQPRGIEINRFDALNMFADVRVPTGCMNGKLWVRGGRQELAYGEQRLISPLDWSNTRRTFDGFKMFYRGCDWDIDGFWVRPIRFGQHVPRDTNFDHPNQQEEFLGLYLNYKGRPGTTVNFYFLRLANYSGGVERRPLFPPPVTGDADPNTFGMLLKGDCSGLLWNLECGYQFGEFVNNDISAGFCTLGLGHKFSNVCMKPTLWAYYDWASGDRNPEDGRHNTFNQYFPLAHKYLGFMDIIGRQNIEDLNLLLTMAPHEKVKLILWYHMFWLDQPTDALYNAGGAPIYRDPTGASGDEVGTEIDFLIQYQLTPRVNWWFGYSHFFAGDYFQSRAVQAAPNLANGDDADFFYTQMTLRF